MLEASGSIIGDSDFAGEPLAPQHPAPVYSDRETSEWPRKLLYIVIYTIYLFLALRASGKLHVFVLD